MKKFLGLGLVMLIALITGLAGEARTELNLVSKRMQGLGPDLIGIVEDDYSGFTAVNPTRILDLEKYRIYTNLSNLGSFDEMPLGGGPAAGELLLGFTVPLEEDESSVGAPIIWTTREKEESPINYYVINDFEEAGSNIVSEEDNLETTGGPGGTRDGKYVYEDENFANNTFTSEKGHSSNDTSSHDINIYAARSFWDFYDTGVSLRHYTLTDTNIEKDYFYEFKNEAEEDDWEDREYESTHAVNESAWVFAPSLRDDRGDLKLGLTAKIAVITNRDEKNIEAETRIGRQRLIDEYGEGSASGYYAREYRYTLNKTMSGMGYGSQFDGEFSPDPSLKISALADFYYEALDGQHDEREMDFIKQSSGIAITNERYEFKHERDREESGWEMGVQSGIEKEISENFRLGSAVGYRYSSYKEFIDPVIYIDNDVHDLTKIATSTTTENKESRFFIPLGLEWEPVTWFTARIGANYSVTGTKEIVTVEKDEYEDDTVSLTNAVVVKETTTKTTSYTYDDSVEFYSGVGFNISDNIIIDITGISDTGGTGLNEMLDLSSWGLGLIVKLDY